MIRHFAAALAALSLVACGGAEEADEPLPGQPSPTATATPAAVGSNASEIQIPAAIRGRWGLVPADCTSTRGDNKGLIVIDAETIKFYESLATLQLVKEVRESRILATFGFTGEGQEWTRDQELDLKADGRELVRTEHGTNAMAGSLVYTRCA